MPNPSKEYRKTARHDTPPHASVALPQPAVPRFALAPVSIRRWCRSGDAGDLSRYVLPTDARPVCAAARLIRQAVAGHWPLRRLGWSAAGEVPGKLAIGADDPHRFASQPLDALFQIALMPLELSYHQPGQSGARIGSMLTSFLVDQHAG